MIPAPVTADDVKLLLWRVETMLMPAEQRERLTAWLEAKRDALDSVGAYQARFDALKADSLERDALAVAGWPARSPF